MTDLFETRAFKGDELNEWLRENTGRRLTDSGDLYGRIYDSPPDDFDLKFSSEEEGLYPIVSTKYFVEYFFDHLPNLQTEFDAYAEASERTYDEDMETFMKEQGYKEACRTNTCNRENDLSQDFCYTLYVPVNFDCEDEYFGDCDELIAALRFHTGCDLRSGYSRACFVQSNGTSSYSFPLDFHASFWDEDDFSDDLNNCRETPAGELNKAIEEKGWEVIKKGDRYVVLNVDGEQRTLHLSLS